jgi:CRISPR-associated protein Csd2
MDISKTDPQRRHEFVLLFDVTDGNPNGDPDAGNMPRTDPETGRGLVTDVALKRKVRDFVTLVGQAETDPQRKAALNIYVEHRGVLNSQHRKAYEALNIKTTESASKPVPEDLREAFQQVLLPDGFALTEAVEEGDAIHLTYSGELEQSEFSAALGQIEEELGKPARKLAEELAKSAKGRKPSRTEVEQARKWMCAHFFDVRLFGAVMSTGVNAGQVRGPMQLTFSRSVDPVYPRDLAITRVAVTKEEDSMRKETEMGRKNLVHYGLYVAHGFYSPFLADGTGVTEADLTLFWEALQHMWETDRSASRGLMAPRGLYVFTHEKKLGNAPAHKLFDLVQVVRKEGVTVPRQFQDYRVQVTDPEAYPGVRLDRILES